MRLLYRYCLVFCVMAIYVSIAALAQQVPMTQITGLVRDSVSRQGIPYATVTLIGTDEGTLANEKGGFTINSRARFSRLRVSAMGYSPKDVEVKTGQGSVVLIDLSPTGVELGEVVVHKGKEK